MMKAIAYLFSMLISLIILFSFFVFAPEMEQAATIVREEIGLDSVPIDEDSMDVPFEHESEQAEPEESSKRKVFYHARDVDEILKEKPPSRNNASTRQKGLSSTYDPSPAYVLKSLARQQEISAQRSKERGKLRPYSSQFPMRGAR